MKSSFIAVLIFSQSIWATEGGLCWHRLSLKEKNLSQNLMAMATEAAQDKRSNAQKFLHNLKPGSGSWAWTINRNPETLVLIDPQLKKTKEQVQQLRLAIHVIEGAYEEQSNGQTYGWEGVTYSRYRRYLSQQNHNHPLFHSYVNINNQLYDVFQTVLLEVDKNGALCRQISLDNDDMGDLFLTSVWKEVAKRRNLETKDLNLTLSLDSDITSGL